ncbi:STAS domain-containing protein [Amycolatopsis sp. cg9]|uniref:STAS domain-containing protein n=1 Tax=Amycolatopsis sp. cg9 TaxID=3238801 RepID=UPI003526141F
MDHSEFRDDARPRLAHSSRPPLRLTSTRHRDTVVLTVAGEIDLSTTSTFCGALAGVIAQRPALLVVDLSPTTFLACAGLTILAAAHHLVGARTHFAVVAGSRASWRPLHLTGLDRQLRVHPCLGDVTIPASPLVLRTVVADAAIQVTATGGSRPGDAAAMTAELRQACELCSGVVLFDVSACTLSDAAVVGSVRAATARGGKHRCGIQVLTETGSLRTALDAAGIAHRASAGPSW